MFSFGLVYFFLFFAVSSISGMLIPFLQYKGYQPVQIGTLISIYTLMGLFGQLGVGFFCEKFRTIKKIFIFCLVITLITTTLSIHIRKSLLFYLSFYTLGVFIGLLASLYDSWVLDGEYKCKFGKLRSYGALGWAFGVLSTGYIVSYFGYKILNIVFILFITITILITLKINDIKKEEKNKMKLKEILINKDYDFLVLSLLVVSISYRSYIQIIPYYIGYIGKTTSSIGMYYFLSAICEMIMLSVSINLMKKYSPDKLLILTPIALVIQFLVLYFSKNIIIVYVSSILNLFTFPIILMVGRIMVDRVSKKETKTTSQLIGFAIYNSSGIIIASFFVGFFVEYFGIPKTLIILILFTILSLIVTIYYDRKTIDKCV
ncbi:MAG: MFS transporter [Peptostreptococcaceae bacterium]